jgi:hypothetical protein
MSKEVTIYSILESSDYDSKLCHDIFAWYTHKAKIGETKNEFVFTELGNWLLEHHIPFINDYSGSKIGKSYRLHSRRSYIQSRIDDLLFLELIERKGTSKSEKSHIDIPVYSFTMEGLIFAWLLEAKDSKEKDRSKAIDKVFELLSVCLLRINSHSAYFFSIFLKKCIDKRLSTYYDDDAVKTLSIITTDFAFPVNRPTIYFRLFFSVAWSIYNESIKILVETIGQLDKDIQKLILLQFKLDIESEYDGFYITRDWEAMRYNNLQNYDKVTIQGRCESCKAEYPFQVNIMEFLKFPYIYAYDSDVDIKIERLNCKNCRKQNSVIIIPKYQMFRPRFYGLSPKQ